eukprot:GHVN01040109.1.p1 GENE.GHVN01040109.1~~GHVN01040109.1.p1  ORF type:complete len:593 (+),score=188.97 GHVN01040109.1:146-1924(+)
MATNKKEGVKPTKEEGTHTGKKMPKIDLEKFDNMIKAETDTIEKLEAEIQTVFETIKGGDGDRTGYQKNRDEKRKNLDDLRTKITELQEEKQNIFNTMDEQNKKGKAMKNQIANMKRNIGFTSEEEIDSKIKEIERAMMTSSMTAKEEKQCITQISQLKQSKPMVTKLHSMSSEASTETTNIEPLKTRLNEVKDELSKLMETRKTEGDALKNMSEEWDKSHAPIKALYDKKNELLAQVRVHKQKRNSVHQELYEERKKLAEIEREQKRLKYERMREEKAQQARQRNIDKLKTELEDKIIEPFSYEVVDLRAAQSYLKRQQGHAASNEAVEEGEKAVEGVVGSTTEDGETIVMPKKNRSEEYYLLPKGKPKKGKNKKLSTESKKKPLVHEIRTMADFDKLGIPLPLTVDDIPASLKVIDEKLSVAEAAHSIKMNKWRLQKDSLERKLAGLEAGKTLEEVQAMEADLNDEVPVGSEAHADDEPSAGEAQKDKTDGPLSGGEAQNESEEARETSKPDSLTVEKEDGEESEVVEVSEVIEKVGAALAEMDIGGGQDEGQREGATQPDTPEKEVSCDSKMGGESQVEANEEIMGEDS